MVFNLSDRQSYLLGISLAVVFLISLPAASETLVVSHHNAEFGSIQTAIAEAQVGDTILIKEGTYKENLVINKAITLEGTKRNKVELVGTKQGHPILLVNLPTNDRVILTSMTIRDAEGMRCAVPDKVICPSGLILKGTSTVQLQDVSISDNEIGVGAIDSSRVIVSKSFFDHNGVGVMNAQTSTASITSSVLRNNKLAGTLLLDSSRAEIYDTTVVRNQIGIGLAGDSLLFAAPSENEMLASLPNNAGLKAEDNIIASNQVGLLSLSQKEIAGHGNVLMNNNLAFVGNISDPGGLRKNTTAGTKEKITLPSDNYDTLQQAISDLSTGGTLIVAKDISVKSAVIDKEITIRSPGNKHIRITTGESSLPFLSLVGQADVTINRVKLTKSAGIYLGGKAKITILNSSFTANAQPLILMGSSRARIDSSRLTGSKNYGITLLSNSQLTVTQSIISDNNWFGIGLWDHSKLQISQSKIAGNRPNGLVLADKGQANIADNQLVDNKHYGLALRIDKCGFDYSPGFTGQVTGNGNYGTGNGNGLVCPRNTLRASARDKS